MNIRSAKAKGRRLAQDVKDKLLNVFKTLTDDDVLITPSSCSGKDLILSREALRKFPFVIECKNQETIRIWSAIEQAEAYEQLDQKPLLVFSRNRSEVYACLKLNDLLSLFEEREVQDVNGKTASGT